MCNSRILTFLLFLSLFSLKSLNAEEDVSYESGLTSLPPPPPSPPAQDYVPVENPTQAFEDAKRNRTLMPRFHRGTYSRDEKPLFPIFKDTLKPRKTKTTRANGYSTFKSPYVPTAVVFSHPSTGNDVVAQAYGDTSSIWGEWYYDEEHAASHPGESGHTFIKVTDSSKSPINVPAGYYISQTTGGIYQRSAGALIQVGQIRNSIYQEGDPIPEGYDPRKNFFIPGMMIAGGGGIEWFKEVKVKTISDDHGLSANVDINGVSGGTEPPDIASEAQQEGGPVPATAAPCSIDSKSPPTVLSGVVASSGLTPSVVAGAAPAPTAPCVATPTTHSSVLTSPLLTKGLTVAPSVDGAPTTRRTILRATRTGGGEAQRTMQMPTASQAAEAEALSSLTPPSRIILRATRTDYVEAPRRVGEHMPGGSQYQGRAP